MIDYLREMSYGPLLDAALLLGGTGIIVISFGFLLARAHRKHHATKKPPPHKPVGG